ncbi:MAG: diguanylate cyclase [Rhizobium sp. 63-7]|nr:MAG: diguanylate cyclase [Rhizobium sp. 63-7]
MNPVRSEREFQNIFRRLQLALESSRIGVWEHDPQTDEVLWDLQMHALYQTGRTDPIVHADDWTKALHPDDIQKAMADFTQAVAHKGAYSSDFRIVLPNGDIRHIRSRAHYFEEAGRATLIGAEWDITADIHLNRELTLQKAIAERRAIALERSHAQIEHAADHDYLTGLPNRRYFDRRLAELCEGGSARSLAILHIDLDNFKAVNDTHGHAAGDAVLMATAQILRNAAPAGSFASRVGGDEFILMLPDFGSTDEAMALARALARRHKAGVMHDGTLLKTSLSIGLAWTTDGNTASLLADSDIALYAAKKNGRGRIERFLPAMKEQLIRERLLTEQLKQGLENGDLVPYYQVQVDARTRAVVAMEALVRWQHPEHGLLLPEAFLDIVADADLAAQLDETVLLRVLADRLVWQSAGIAVPRISINISAGRLAEPSLLQQLAKLHIEPDAISFELLETIFLDELDDTALSNIQKLKHMGIDVEFDDFGSGHASIVGLVKLKPKRLKIDRRLVFPIIASAEQTSLVSSIVDIARTLNIEVIAEGVETLEHAEILANLGCQILQGYAIAFPLSAVDLGAYLGKHGKQAAPAVLHDA